MFLVEGTTKGELQRIIRANVSPEAHIRTDEGRWYLGLVEHFASHDTVNHGATEYGRGDVHTNTVEGYFSVFKRGMKGIRGGSVCLNRSLREDKWSPAGFRLLQIAAAG